MTSDERAQLVEDIKTCNRKREAIVQRAELDQDFDIAAAWEDVADLDDSIAKRVIKAGPDA